MIDLHSHIIPAVDDGPATLEQTGTMLSLAAADGIAEMVATPHCDLRYNFDPEHCRRSLERIRKACPDGPRLCLGCELHLTPENIEQVVASPSRYTLNGGDCLLVELPDTIPLGAVEAGLSAFLNAGLRPIIAHPERSLLFQRNPAYANRLVEFGCHFQLTAQSFSGGFGPAAEKLANNLLTQRLVHFVASDCHGVTRRRPLLAHVYAGIASQCGWETAELLFVVNPRAVLSSGPFRQMPPAARRSVIFRLFKPGHGLIKAAH